ncbi:MAG: M28 family peptidase [Fidelibacterota bacterium]
MKPRSWAWAVFAAILAMGWSSRDETKITSWELREHIKSLASDDMEGRRAGTRGDRKAARYLTRAFRSYGLDPVGKGQHSLRSPFTFTAGVELGRRNAFRIETGGELKALRLGKDFRPLGFSSSGEVEGQLVFAGYGIVAGEMGYDDYGPVEVEGKVVLALFYSPDGTNPHGEFGPYVPARRKAMTAREKGAAAIILVMGPREDPDPDYLMGLSHHQGAADSGIPVVTVTQRQANELLSLADRDLAEVQDRIHETRQPQSFHIPVQVFVKTSLEKVEAKTWNVVGMVKGSDPELADEYVVVGAHYDHLGWGGEGSLAPDTVAIHNGADDNASGTAGLLELAEWFSGHPGKRSIIFAAFGAEELGLLGSTHFVNDPPVPLENVVAMLNMDMIGRMEDSTLVVGGVGTSSIWKDLVNDRAGPLGLSPKFDDPGYGSSDHQSFYLKDIPVLFFFTGIHDDYSRPSDDWEKINIPGEERIVRLVRDVTREVATRKETPNFVKVERAQPVRGGFPVYLGTVPDYSATDVEGMRLAGVREGGPAHQGGLRGGDIIVRFGSKDVKNIYDFMYALQEARADEPVSITVLREGKERVLEVTPARRKD